MGVYQFAERTDGVSTLGEVRLALLLLLGHTGGLVLLRIDVSASDSACLA